MHDIELYDRRFDWLVASLLHLPPVWAFYGFDAAFLTLPLFLLIGALKPLKRALASPLAAGIFAAGCVLLVSPLLRFLFSNGYCFDAPLSILAGFDRYAYLNLCQPSLFGEIDQQLWIGPLRDAALPVIGLGLMVGMWVNRPKSAGDQADLEPPVEEATKKPKWQKLLPWSILLLAIPVWLGLSLRNHLEVLAQAEAVRQVELARQAQEAAAAKVAAEEAAEEAKRLAAEEGQKHVDLSWLMAGWAPIDGLSAKDKANREFYCATDAGYIFKKDGTYTGPAEEGRFSLKDNVISLSNRSSFEIGEPDDVSSPLPPTTVRVQRSGNRLIIDGATYGRC